MSKVLIVPDVHGRTFWHKAEELINDVDKVVFLGDYLDPYSEEGISFEQALEEFKKILQFKETYPDKVVLLIGNHDMHYINLRFMNCSRLNTAMRTELHSLYQEHLDKFALIYNLENKWLFSHAGIYQAWMNKYELTLDDLLDVTEFLREHWLTLEDLSYYRGGYNYTGSCVWADIRESLRHPMLPNIRHIVGHTQLSENPYTTDNVVCVDVRRCFILDTDTNEIVDA